jgi:hypothetical protein
MTGNPSDFHHVRFPDKIAYGASGGPEFATSVMVTAPMRAPKVQGLG